MKGLKETILERKINEGTWTFEALLEDMEDYFGGIFYEDGLKGDANVYWPEDYEGDTYKSPTNEYVLKAVFDKIKETLKENKVNFEYKIS
jgi:hypothetical protein